VDRNDVLRLMSTPVNAPAYSRGRYVFTNREYLTITYRTDPEALRRVVPEPLTVEGPLVRFEVIRMPDVTGLGDYTEAGQLVSVQHEGERGEFNLAMYVDNLPAIASGREVSAFPKKLGAPSLYVDSDTLVGTLDYGSLRVATATMGYKHQPLDLDEARDQITAPTYMLKMMRGYDGRPRICELVRAQITDVTVKHAWSGPSRLQLFAHVLAPLADLPVLEVVAASHIITNLTLPAPRVVHDYLTDSAL
jgi:acetoacetate decarboxylase